MKGIKDWFFAGAVVGFIGGIFHLMWNSALLLIGIQHKTFWIAMAGLFYNQELVYTPLAQVHGAIDALGASVVGGILISFIVKYTGRDYIYTKSVILSSSVGYFLFIVVMPQSGLGKESVVVPWVAIIGFMVFNGLLEDFILKRIWYFKQSIRQNESSHLKNRQPRGYYVNRPEPEPEFGRTILLKRRRL